MPCVDGCCLNWRKVEKSNDGALCLRHLIDHFLRRVGLAQGARSDFGQFTFAHVVEGVIAAERTDTRELYLIRAVDNVVTTETLVPGDHQAGDVVPAAAAEVVAVSGQHVGIPDSRAKAESAWLIESG
jgi:hypothetical protein